MIGIECMFWMFTEIQTHECLPGLSIGLHFSEDSNGKFLCYTQLFCNSMKPPVTARLSVMRLPAVHAAGSLCVLQQ